jgi:hypothetical protein
MVTFSSQQLPVESLYHFGFSEPIAKSTLVGTNESRAWRT